jgi:CBS-domain-containing membrane protein
MTENSAARVRAALLDPTAVFAAPEEVERDAALSRDEKLAILAHWEEDALELAENEAGDTGRAARRLEEVRAARARLTGESGAAAQGQSGRGQRVRRFARPVHDIIHADHEMDEAALQLSLQEHPVLPVADGDQIVGVLARSELARAAEQQTRDARITARVMMTTEIAFCYLDDDVATAHALMDKHGCDHLLVIDREGVLVGTVERDDLPAASPGETQAVRERPEVVESHQNHGQGVASTIQPGGLNVYDERPTIRASRR